MNAFVTARIRAVAQAVGAPHDESSSCVPNVQILFTLEPQQLIDEAIKRDSRKGVEMLDEPEAVAVPDGGIAALGVGVFCR